MWWRFCDCRLHACDALWLHHGWNSESKWKFSLKWVKFLISIHIERDVFTPLKPLCQFALKWINWIQRLWTCFGKLGNKIMSRAQSFDFHRHLKGWKNIPWKWQATYKLPYSILQVSHALQMSKNIPQRRRKIRKFPYTLRSFVYFKRCFYTFEVPVLLKILFMTHWLIVVSLPKHVQSLHGWCAQFNPKFHVD